MFSNVWISLAALPACLGLLILASDYFLSGAIAIASRLRLPEFVVGSLIVAVGTSAPELAINIAAGLEDRGDIVISNLVGSNIVNICLGIGLAGLFAAYPAIGITYVRALVLGLAGAFVLLALTFASAGGGFSSVPRIAGVALVAIFTVYVWQSLRTGGIDAEDEIVVDSRRGVGGSVAMLVGGCLGMALFADLAVGAAVSVSTYMGIPQAVIGATVIAAGGSLPEIFSCISAARRGMPNIVLGNIAGSQIFNLFGILGVTALVTDITFSTVLWVDMAVLVAATLALFALGLAGRRPPRAMAPVLLVIYAAYGGYLVHASL